MRRLKWIFAALVLMTLLWLRFNQQSVESQEAGGLSRADQTASHQGQRDGDDKNSAARNKRENVAQRSNGGADSPMIAAQFSTSEDLFQLVNVSEAQALAGDADASYYIARAFDECITGRVLLDADDESIQKRLDTIRSPEKRQLAAQAVDRRRQRCFGFANYSEEEGQALIKEWLDRAAAQGSLAAEAALVTEELAEMWLHPQQGFSEENRQAIHSQLNELGRRALENRNADAIMELSSAFDVTYFTDDEWLNNFADVQSPGQMWELIACDFGYPCHNDANIVQGTCAYYGICGYPSLEAAYQSELYPPAAWAEMNAMRFAIHRAIAEGSVGDGVRLPSS